MAIDMEALCESLSLVTPEQAEAAMAASMATQLEKYGPPSKDAVCLESPVKAAEDIPATKMEDDMKHREIPDDFPRDRDPGSVTGVQAKLLVREVDGRYQAGLTDEELWVRYDVCEDLAGQLSDYVRRKMATTGLTTDVALSRAEKGARLKGDSGEWDFSQPELDWVIERTRHLLRGDSDEAQAGLP